jgi:hypothetical protein
MWNVRTHLQQFYFCLSPTIFVLVISRSPMDHTHYPPLSHCEKKNVSDWNGLVQQSFQCRLERPTRIAELQRPRLLREPLVQGTGDCGPQVKNSSFTDLLVVVVVPLITWSSLRICLGVLLASPTTIHTHPVECLFWQYRRKHSTYGMSRVSLRQQTVRR